MGYFKREQQQDASLQRGMPVDVVADTSIVIDITGEVLAFNFYNAGVLTVDAGEAAGTNVIAKFTRSGLLNAIGDVIATNKNTSISFTGTGLLVEKPFPYLTAELYDENDGNIRLDKVVEKAQLGLANGGADGDYVVDYRTGTVYGVKADATTSMTADYKTQSSASSSGGGPTADVNLTDVSGSPITLGQTTMAGSLPVAIASDQTALPVVTGALTSILSGSQTVATAGTPVQLTVASTPSTEVSVQADIANTGNILVGNVTSQDVVLVAGDSVTLSIDDLDKVYIDSTVNAEGVNFIGSN